jgi:hypothetical protein
MKHKSPHWAGNKNNMQNQDVSALGNSRTFPEQGGSGI